MNPITFNPKTLLVGILDIIDFQEDKEKFAEQFLQVCMQRSFVDLIESLPDDKKQLAMEDFSKELSADEIYAILRNYFTPEEYTMVLVKSTLQFFNDYIVALKPTLSQEKIQRLEIYLSQISSQTNAIRSS